MRLKLLRANEDDLPALVPIMFRAFSKLQVFDALLGRQTAEDQALALERLRKEIRSDRADVWLKVVDEDSGTVVAGSNWKVFAGYGHGEKLEEHHEAEWLPEGSVERRAAEHIQRTYYERRERYLGKGPNVRMCRSLCPDSNGTLFFRLHFRCSNTPRSTFLVYRNALNLRSLTLPRFSLNLVNSPIRFYISRSPFH